MDLLLNPKKEKFEHLDEKSAGLMKNTINWFENKGKQKIKEDDRNRVWYSDFLEFQAGEKAFARLMTPSEYGEDDARHDAWRNCDFNEILGFYGLPYWYTWQVTMLGLGPIWMSDNEEIKKKTAELLRQGDIFAFGLSEKEHGADLISSEMKLQPKDDGTYVANGSKYYIGNANKAALVSTFGRVEGSGDYVFFAVSSQHENYELVKNTVASQNYVAEYAVHNYPITEKEILSMGREAWDASLATIAYCKYNLGWASIGICTHAFYESITHATHRILFKHSVTEFPHIKQFFVDAYTRLVAMRLFARRASDYMRAAGEDDKRYLLYNPMVKMKVTIQGEEVINLLWDVIAAKGFEKDMFFEMAARDIRALPKLEGTAQVNMVLLLKFIHNYLNNPAEYDELPEQTQQNDDSYMFQQGATSKGQNRVRFHDYNIAYNSVSHLPNVKVFQEQIEVYKEFFAEAGPDRAQNRDLDFMLNVGEIFTLIPYGQLIIERAAQQGVKDEVLDQIFDFMVRDFSRYALQVYEKTSSTEKQQQYCLKMIRKPEVNTERYMHVWENYVKVLADDYRMND